jgi:hypothetical protein
MKAFSERERTNCFERAFISVLPAVTSALILIFFFGVHASAQDLSYRIRNEVLDQWNPVIVNVSTSSCTTVQFPGPIQSLESDGFTTKPNDEAGDFYISPGVNWFSVRALKPAAVQNLGVVIYGRVYEIVFQTVAVNDLAVIFHFPARRAQTARAWAPPLKP